MVKIAYSYVRMTSLPYEVAYPGLGEVVAREQRPGYFEANQGPGPAAEVARVAAVPLAARCCRRRRRPVAPLGYPGPVGCWALEILADLGRPPYWHLAADLVEQESLAPGTNDAVFVPKNSWHR